jgi:hypothetical protein
LRRTGIVAFGHVDVYLLHAGIRRQRGGTKAVDASEVAVHGTKAAREGRWIDCCTVGNGLAINDYFMCRLQGVKMHIATSLLQLSPPAAGRDDLAGAGDRTDRSLDSL